LDSEKAFAKQFTLLDQPLWLAVTPISFMHEVAARPYKLEGRLVTATGETWKLRIRARACLWQRSALRKVNLR